MRNPILVRLTLVLSGLIATGVGLGILAIPQTFHASSGIALGDDVNLLNEMRAAGGPVLVGGLFALFGAIRLDMAYPALVLSATVYLAYGLARFASVIVDGVPNAAMLQIMGLELAVAAICMVVLRSESAARSKPA